MNSSWASQSSDSLLLEYPDATDLVTWNAYRDAAFTTYTIGNPPVWDAYFLDRGAAEIAAGEFDGSYCRWDGKTGHMVTVPEREAGRVMATWTDYDCERDAELALTELTGASYYRRIEGKHQAEQGARKAVARSWEEVSVELDREPEEELSW